MISLYALTNILARHIVAFADMFRSNHDGTDSGIGDDRSTERWPKARFRLKMQGVKAVAEAFGYTPEELTSIPAEANMGLSCGNPTATAHIRPGEVVVDLGSGGGLDVFLASKMVGPEGRAIGIDMTPRHDRAGARQRQGGRLH